VTSFCLCKSIYSLDECFVAKKIQVESLGLDWQVKKSLGNLPNAVSHAEMCTVLGQVYMCVCVCVRVHILCNTYTHIVLGQSIAKINGWDDLAIAGHFASFNLIHDWVFTPTGDFEWTKISDGIKEWCEYEQSCNHMPWDVEAESQEKCVDSYQANGDRAMQGESFCAQVR